MSEAVRCALCREDIEGEPVMWKGKFYCCQACAFEASKRLGSMCGSGETTEVSQRFESRREAKSE